MLLCVTFSYARRTLCDQIPLRESSGVVGRIDGYPTGFARRQCGPPPIAATAAAHRAVGVGFIEPVGRRDGHR